MPNNNPHGHNQYTKPELRSQKNKKPAQQPNPSGSTDAPSGSNPTHESDNENGSSSESSHSALAGAAEPVASVAPAAPSATSSGTSRRGFASMDAALQREIASKGGHSQGRENNPGNFANDREKAREAGRKGGEAHGHR